MVVTAPMTVSVYDYKDAIAFLEGLLAARVGRNPQYSMRSLARSLGIPNVGLLSMVLKRRRPIPESMAEKIGEVLDLPPAQAGYLRLMIWRDRARSDAEREFFEQAMQQARLSDSFAAFSTEAFRKADQWYHFVIMEMTYLADFQPSADWIASRMGGAVSPQEIMDAILRLIDLGMLAWTNDGLLIKAQPRLKSPSENRSAELRDIHKQFMRQALQAADKQSLDQRDLSNHVVITSRRKIAEAKNMIRDFRLQLGSFLQQESGDTVYTLSIQLFDNLAGEQISPCDRQ